MKQSPSLCSPMATTHQSLPSLLPLLLLLYSQFSITDAQQTNITQEQQRPYNPSRSFTQVTAVLIIIMTAAIFFTGFFFVYIRSRRQAAVNTRFRTFIPEMRLPDRGLDPAVIGTFPTVAYSGVKGLKMGDSPLECAVCLSEFDDDDELTLLPVCHHVFHPHCIGTWLTSHSTCPVCRANLNVPLQEPVGTEVMLNLEIRGENRGGAEEDVPIDNHEEVEAGDQLRRTGIKRSINGRIIRPWRSKSARPAVGRSGSRTMIGKAWAEEERERFTLRLQESIRKDLVAGTSELRRSATTTELPVPRNACGEESPRMGYKRGAGGGSCRLSMPFGETARSGRRWVFGGDWGCGSSRGKGVGDGEPLDCITGDGTGGKGVDSGGDENDNNLKVNGGY